MILIKNVTIVNFYPPQVVSNKDILIDKGLIIEVGNELDRKYNADKIIFAKDKLISPGLVCSHNHFYSALARGIIAKINPSKNFVEILQNLWWRLDRALDEESLYYSGLIGALESIKCGTTSVIDHHASPGFIKGSLSILKNVFEKAGLRGILCYEVTDRNGEKGILDGIEESLNFAQTVESEKIVNNNYLVEAAIGGHAAFTLNNKSLSYLAEAVDKTKRGIHIHTAEDIYDWINSKELFGKNILERLEDFNLVSSKSIFVHGVFLEEKDIKIINAFDSFLIHNPRSNMNNSVGYFSKLQDIKNIAVGTDGIGSNMFEETKIAYFKSQDAKTNTAMGDFLKFLQNGNILLERYFNQKFGCIQEGYKADLVIFDYNSPTPLNEQNLTGHFIFGMSSRDVETVIINGKIVYEERQFPFDIRDIYTQSQSAAKKMWERMDKILD